MYELQVKTRELSQGEDNEETKRYILDEGVIDYNEIKHYDSQLQFFQNKYHNSLHLVNDYPRSYFEDVYYRPAKKYLDNLNSKITIFKEGLDNLKNQQNNYDTYVTSIVSEINNKGKFNTTLITTIAAILVTVLLFLVEHIRKRYGYTLTFIFVFFGIILYLVWKGIPTLFLLIGLGIVVWMVLPSFFALIYLIAKNKFNLSKETGNNLDLIFKCIYYLTCNSILFNCYINSAKNNESTFHEFIRSLIILDIEKTLNKKKELMNSPYTVKKEKIRNIRTVILKSTLLKQKISFLLSHKKIISNDHRKLEEFNKQLENVKEDLVISPKPKESFLDEGVELNENDKK